jgi:hypothetical protein
MIFVTIICKKCKKDVKIYAKGLCELCYKKRYMKLDAYLYGKHIQWGLGKVSEEEVKEAKKMYKKILKEKFEDVIKNPRKYLGE